MVTKPLARPNVGGLEQTEVTGSETSNGLVQQQQ